MRNADLLQKRFGYARPVHQLLDDPVLSRLLGRRTHRKYSPQKVPDVLIDTLLDVAASASSKSDFQQASVIVVRDPQRRQKLAQLVPAMPWIGEAPAFIVFCADARRLEKICTLREKPLPNRNLESFFNASIDAALLMQTFILAAEHTGLGCCPISVIRNHLPSVMSILSIPELVIPVAGLCVGYPASEGYVSMRLPPEVTRHIDRYCDEDLPEEIASYDRRREQRVATPREKQRSPARFGYLEFYGWSEDKSRQAQAGEGREYGAMIRHSGFTLE